MVAMRSKAFTDMAPLSTPFSTLPKLNPMAAPLTKTITLGTEDARMALLAGMTTKLVVPQHRVLNTARATGAQDLSHTDVNSPTLLPINGSNTRTRRSSASASPERSETLPAGADGTHGSVLVSNETLSKALIAMEPSSKLAPHPSSKALRVVPHAGRPIGLQENNEGTQTVSAEGLPAPSDGMVPTTLPNELEKNFVILGEQTNGVSSVLRKGTGAGFLAIISRKMLSLAAQQLYEAATPELGQDVSYAVAHDLERLLNETASNDADYRRQIRQQSRSLEENDVELANMLRRVETRMLRGGSMDKQSKDAKVGKKGAIDSGLPSSLPSAMQPNVETPPSSLTQPSPDPSGTPAIVTLRRWLSARKNQTDNDASLSSRAQIDP